MPVWTLLIPAISSLLDKIIPDPAARDAAKLALTQAENAAALQQLQLDVQAAQMQSDIDKQELSTVLMGMLGLGGLRTIEKINDANNASK